MAGQGGREKGQEDLRDAWGELGTVCREIRYRLFACGDEASAAALSRRLERVLGRLPADEMAIIREEGLSLYYQLRGELARAAEHRRREIALIERLHASIQASVSEGRDGADVAVFALQGRDAAALAERRELLRSLERRAGEPR